MDQLPSGLVLTPAISCTKFKIHSAHADSPMAKTFFFSFFFFSRQDQFLHHRPRALERECVWLTNSLLGGYVHQLSLVQSSRSIQPMQTVPWSKQFFFSFFLGRTSLCVTDQETQEEFVLGRPTPFWVGTYTSYLLYKVQDPFSPCTQSHGQNILFQLFLGRTRQSLRHRPRNSGRECAFWTNSLLGWYLHQLSLVQSSKSIQPMQTVAGPKHCFPFF